MNTRMGHYVNKEDLCYLIKRSRILKKRKSNYDYLCFIAISAFFVILHVISECVLHFNSISRVTQTKYQARKAAVGMIICCLGTRSLRQNNRWKKRQMALTLVWAAVSGRGAFLTISIYTRLGSPFVSRERGSDSE